MSSSRHSGRSDCVFVCGATGTIGKCVLSQLQQLYPDVRVKAQCRDQQKGKSIHQIHPRAELVKLDFDHVEVEPLRGVTSLFLLSPYTVDMCIQVRHIVDAAKEAGVQHIVHLGVHQPKPSWSTKVGYVHWHALAEKYIESSGLSWTHLRPNMFYENLLEYGGVKPLQGSKLSFSLHPNTKVAWVAAEDIARVAAKSLVDIAAHSSQIYPISSAVCTLQDVVSALRSSVPQLKDLQLETPSADDTYKMLVEGGAEPVYMTAFKRTVTEMNEMGDCSGIPGAKEGLDVVKSVGGKEPMNPSEWAVKQDFSRNQ